MGQRIKLLSEKVLAYSMHCYCMLVSVLKLAFGKPLVWLWTLYVAPVCLGVETSPSNSGFLCIYPFYLADVVALRLSSKATKISL